MLVCRNDSGTWLTSTNYGDILCLYDYVHLTAIRPMEDIHDKLSAYVYCLRSFRYFIAPSILSFEMTSEVTENPHTSLFSFVLLCILVLSSFVVSSRVVSYFSSF